MMCFKSACPQCLVRAEGAVINHYTGDFEIYMFKGNLGVKCGQMKSSEEKELEENRYGCAKF